MSGSSSTVQWVKSISDNAGILLRRTKRIGKPLYMRLHDLFDSYGREPFQVQCFADAWPLKVVTDIGHIIIPEPLDGWYFRGFEAHVNTASTSGKPTFMAHNYTSGNDMLITPLTVDAGAINSLTASVPVVIDTSNAQVTAGDRIRFDCTDKGTGTLGLMLIPIFSIKSP